MKKTSVLAMFGASAMAAAFLVFSSATAATAAPEKVTICHVDQDVVEGEPTVNLISVSSNALDAHLAHGDWEVNLELDPASADCAVAPAPVV